MAKYKQKSMTKKSSGVKSKSYAKVYKKKKKIKKKDPVGDPKNWSTPVDKLTPKQIDMQKVGVHRMSPEEFHKKWDKK
jgi:hypothetical protein